MLRGVDPFATLGTVAEGEGDPRTRPPLLDPVHEAVDMADVAAFGHDGGGVANPSGEADGTEVVLLLAFGRGGVLLDTVLVETGQAFLLATEAWP